MAYVRMYAQFSFDLPLNQDTSNDAGDTNIFYSSQVTRTTFWGNFTFLNNLYKVNIVHVRTYVCTYAHNTQISINVQV